MIEQLKPLVGPLVEMEDFLLDAIRRRTYHSVRLSVKVENGAIKFVKFNTEHDYPIDSVSKPGVG